MIGDRKHPNNQAFALAKIKEALPPTQHAHTRIVYNNNIIMLVYASAAVIVTKAHVFVTSIFTGNFFSGVAIAV